MTKARENSDYTGLQGDLALKSPVASPVFTGNVGINNSSPTQRLETNGNAQFNMYDDPSGAGGYYTTKGMQIGNAFDAGLSGGDDDRNAIVWNERGTSLLFGTNNIERMRINADGIVTMPYQPAFAAKASGGWTVITSASNQPIVMNDERVDKNNDYDPSTYKFTAPVTGTYFFTLNSYTRRTSGGNGDYMYIGFSINNVNPTNSGFTETILHYIDNGTGDLGSSVSAIYALSSGDTVHANVRGSSSNCAYHGTSCSWGGHLIG